MDKHYTWVQSYKIFKALILGSNNFLMILIGYSVFNQSECLKIA